jgi:hypothetical protein
VSAYTVAEEEALHTRDLLKGWAAEGFISEAQYRQMEEESACELRRTNIFLRVVLFLFTLLIVGAAAGLFFEIFVPRPSEQTIGVFLLIFAALSYGAAELTVSRARLYRYGIEEALAACSVGFLCLGMHAALFSAHGTGPNGMEFLVPSAGAFASLWIWHRFGLAYAFLAAMIFAIWLPGCWTSSHTAQHLIVASLYAGGLIVIAAVRAGYRFGYLDDRYSIVEALLWLGVYLAINLQVSTVNRVGLWWSAAPTAGEFPREFYWATWILTWCLPAVTLARGLRRKDRFVIAAGTIAAVLTLVTNKPYLGWQRHTWDPMLLGAVLIGAALLIRRSLAGGPAGIRHGFTAQRLSAKEKHWMNAGATAFGLVAPASITPGPPAASPGVRFEGGDSAGGGASSEF